MDEARKIIANYFNVSYENIIFTASGTISNNIAYPCLTKNINEEVVSSELEHASVYNTLIQKIKTKFLM